MQYNHPESVAPQTAEARARQNEGTEKVSGDPTDGTQHRREPGTGLREDFSDLDIVNADPECVVSWCRLHRRGIGIEFADEAVWIFLGEGPRAER